MPPGSALKSYRRPRCVFRAVGRPFQHRLCALWCAVADARAENPNPGPHKMRSHACIALATRTACRCQRAGAPMTHVRRAAKHELLMGSSVLPFAGRLVALARATYTPSPWRPTRLAQLPGLCALLLVGRREGQIDQMAQCAHRRVDFAPSAPLAAVVARARAALATGLRDACSRPRARRWAGQYGLGPPETMERRC